MRESLRNFWRNVINLGVMSASAANFWTLTTNPDSPLNAAAAVCADADTVIIDLTINDALVSSTPIATFKAYLIAIAAALGAGGADIVFMTGNPYNPATISDAIQQTYRVAMQEVAVALGRPMIDQYDLYGSYANMIALGYIVPNVHPIAAGYAHLGQFVGATLKAACGL